MSRLLTSSHSKLALQVGNQLLEEADKQMNFLNSIMDMMSSAFWSNENDSSEENDGNMKNSKLLVHCFFINLNNI